MLSLRAYSTSPRPFLDEVPPPDLGPAEVRIKVTAAAVNPVDVGIVSGPVRAAADLPDPVGLGWDVSGTVTEAGSDVTDLEPGDRVAGFLNVVGIRPSVGTHAEETVLPAAAVAPIPRGLDLVEAASLPLTASAARQALDLLGPSEGRSLLVTGGAGAVGGHAMVLAAREGWQVSALVRPGDDEFVSRAGVFPVTDLPRHCFDAVLDAAILLEKGLTAVRDHGSFIGMAPAAPVTGERGIEAHTVFVEADRTRLASLLQFAAQGTIDVRVAGQVPLSEAPSAYDQVAEGGQRGRWLLIP